MNHEDRVEEKLEAIAAVLSDMRVEIVEIRKDLNYHIKRTNELQKIVEEELPPIKAHVDRVGYSFKAIAYLAGVAGLLGAMVKWIR